MQGNTISVPVLHRNAALVGYSKVHASSIYSEFRISEALQGPDTPEVVLGKLGPELRVMAASQSRNKSQSSNILVYYVHAALSNLCNIILAALTTSPATLQRFRQSVDYSMAVAAKARFGDMSA